MYDGGGASYPVALFSGEVPDQSTYSWDCPVVLAQKSDESSARTVASADRPRAGIGARHELVWLKSVVL